MAGLTGLAVIGAMLSATPSAMADAAPTGAVQRASAVATPKLSYTFDDLTTAAAGTVVLNGGQAGSPLNATVVNSGATVIDDSHGGKALRFPGGAAGTASAHAVIPAGLIAAGQEDLTIRARVKWDDTSSGCRYPFTVGDSATRYLSYLAGCGRAEIKSGSTAATAQSATIPAGAWADMAIVLDGGTSFSFYLDGQLVGTAATGYTASTLIGTGLSGWLSKSPFSVDPYFDGALDDLSVWPSALTAADVADTYNSLSGYFVDRTISELNLGDLSALTANIALPKSGVGGETSVSWTSSNPTVVSTEGAVNAQDTATTGTLTATVKRGSSTKTASFPFTVPAVADPAAANAVAAAAILLPSVLEKGYTLPSAVAGRSATWSVASGATTVTGGKIASAPTQGFTPVVLRATLGSAPNAATKDFAVRVIEEGNATLAGYTTTKTTRNTDDPELEQSVHLAVSSNGTSFTALNSGAGVAYAAAEGQSEFANGVKRVAADPYLFRLKGSDGFGVIARRTNVDGSQTVADRRGVLLFTSPDLVQFTEAGFLPLSAGSAVVTAAVEWDAQAQAYRIVWTTADGATSAATTTDWTTLQPVANARALASRTTQTAVAYSAPASLLPLTSAEAAGLQKRLGRVSNTAIATPANLKTEVGQTFSLPSSVKASYSDGQTHDFPVDWNPSQLAAVDTSAPGVYTVTGALRHQPTVFPLIAGRADPHMYRYTDPNTGAKSWLFISTDESGQDDFFIRQASTVEGIKTAADNKMLGTGLVGGRGQLWAPEFHEIDGDLYIIFAGNVSGDYAIENIEAHTVKLKKGANPLSAASWEAPQRVRAANGSFLAEAGLTLTIDMTHTRVGAKDYLIWNQRTKVDANGNPSRSGGFAPAVIKIAEVQISASGPWQLKGEATTISIPNLGWDYNTSPVDEGPFVILRDGKVFVTFSGSGVDETYAVGLLSASASADLLDPASWQKRSYPIWSYEGPIADNWGPGHNAYVQDDDGNLLNVFHAKPTANGTRTAGVRTVYFRTDGSPILDMTDDEWLAGGNRTVSVKITVGEPVQVEQKPLLRYTFDELSSGAVAAGSTIVNTGTAGAAFNGIAVNTGLTAVADKEAGAAVKFPGGAGNSATVPFVRIPTGLIQSGQDDVTIAARVKLDATANTCQWPFMLGQSNTKYIFATTGCGSATYAEVLNGSAKATARRANVLETGWHDVKVVLDGGSLLYYYIDGALVASTATTLTAKDLIGTAQSGWLAKSPYNDAFFNGTIGDFAVYDQALIAIGDVWAPLLTRVGFNDGDTVRVHPDETRTLSLPTAAGAVWTSSNTAVVNPATGVVTAPATGTATVTLTLSLSLDGQTRSKSFTLNVSRPAATDSYGYLLVHFVEDANGYAEKMYFDLTRGDDPTKWDRLNAGKPILASDLGSTGLRDPYLVQNPKTGRYYLMATDLRVFGCRPYTTGGWLNDCSQHGNWFRGANLSRELVFWESDDLVNWSNPWTMPIAQPNQGMAWAPEATWDPIGERFVMYWASKTYPTTVFPNQNPGEAGAYSKIQYGFTTDFRTDFAFGGVMIDKGHDVIDTTIYQYGGKTYRISKDNGDANISIWMEVTSATDWWLPTTQWTTVKNQIGSADYGSVEGPLMFKDTTRNVWYVYVDQYGGSSQGYRPYRVTGLETGNISDIKIEKMSLTDFDMLSTTKHGVVRPLTTTQYAALRKADSVKSIAPVAVTTVQGVAPTLPTTVTVSYQDARFGPASAQKPVRWLGLTAASYANPGTFTVQGVVQDVLPNDQFSAAKSSTLGTTATVTVTSLAVTATVNPAQPTGANDWYNGAVTVTLTAPGSASIEYRTSSSGAWTAYTQAVAAPEGVTTLQYRATDANGVSTAAQTVTVKRDSVAPTAAATLAGRTVTITGADSGSGLDKIQYRIDSGTWTVYTAPVVVAGSASHTVSYRSVDLAGNTSVDKSLEIRAAVTTVASTVAASAKDSTVSTKDDVVIEASVSAAAPFSGTARLYRGSVKVAEKAVTATGSAGAYAADVEFRDVPAAGEHVYSVTFVSADPDAVTGSTSATVAVVVYFFDYPPTATFFDEVAWLVGSGITTGNDDGGFAPYALVTRQAMAAFLFRLENPGVVAPTCQTAPFPDVPTSHRFCGEIAWLKTKNITAGYAGGTFAPGAAIDRQAMAAFLFRLKNPGVAKPVCSSRPFSDVTISNQFCGEIEWFKAQKITTGYDGGLFKPGNKVDRQAMAAFLFRLDNQ